MAEVFGVVSAASTLVEQSLTMLERVQTAVDRQKGHADYITILSTDIRNTRAIVKVVRDEPALRVPSVQNPIHVLMGVVGGLDEFLRLQEAAARAGGMRQFAHQFVKGSKEQRELDALMKRLANVKSDLSLQIQVAHVGLTQRAGSHFVNAILVERIDAQVRRRLGEGKGLRIADLIKEKPRTVDGSVCLSDDDVDTLVGSDDGSFTGGFDTDSSSRVVLNNTALDSAVQVNAPIGTDGFVEVRKLTIKDNVAKGFSTQINHGISRDDFRAAISGRFAGR